MNEAEDRSFNIERCDTCALFVGDTDAAEAMTTACQVGAIEWP